MKRILRLLILICLIAFPSFLHATITGNITSTSALSSCDTPLNAVFSFNLTGGCTGSTTTMWYFTSGGVTDSSTSPFHSFRSYGLYDVSVKVTCTATGETARFTNTGYVNVHPSPIVNFTTTNPGVDTLLSCPHTITFVNTSNADTASSCAITWRWTIVKPDLSVSSFTGPSSISYAFTTPGTYSVYLNYIAGACGCGASRSKVSYIQIQAPAVACYTRISPATYCSGPATVVFSDTCSTGASLYEYHFGDGSAPEVTSTFGTYSHTYSFPGTYSDTMYAITSAGCRTRAERVDDVYIGNFSITMGTAPDTICQHSSASFSDATGHLFSAPSYYVYRGTTGTTVEMSATSTDPATFVFDTAGLFRVEEVATDSLGCTATDSRMIYVRPKPMITGITGDNLLAGRIYRCAPDLVEHFIASITPAAGTSTSSLSYEWSFGDGTTISGTGGTSLTAPAHTYTALGTYSVSLTVSDVHGCTDTSINMGMVRIARSNLQINLTADSGCVTAGHPLHVGIHSSIPPFTPFTTDSITYDDGTAPCVGAACVDTAHDFTTTGLHRIKVWYTLPDSLGGCSDTAVKTILAGGTVPDYHLTQYWMLGSTRVPADSVCPNTNIIFNDSCSNCTYTQWAIHTGSPSAPLTTLEGAGSFYNITNSLFERPGRWDYQLIMTVDGCSDTLDSAVYVFPPVGGTIVPSTPSCAARDSVRFNIVGATGAVSYFWSFGDGGTLATTGTSVTHRYTGAATTRRVVVIDSASVSNHRCTNSDTLMYSTGKPVLSWYASDSTPCVNQAITLFGPLTMPDSSAYPDYYFYFGDGTASVHTDAGVTSVSHTFTRTGTYRDTVIVRNSSGCRDTSRVITIRVLGPSGGFTMTDSFLCLGGSVTFHNANTDPSAVILRPHRWSFNAAPSVPFPATIPSTFIGVVGLDTTIQFNAIGNYNIVLSDTDNHGCYSRDSRVVHVVKPRAYFYSTDSSNKMCQSVPVHFTDTNTHCSYSWNFGDGTGWTTASTSAGSVTHSYSVNGVFNVQCRIIADGTMGYPSGCSDTMTRAAYITVGPTVITSTNFGDDTISSCPPLHIVRFADSSGTYTWHVNPPGGTAGTFTGPFINYTVFGSGTFNVTLINTTPWGCVDSVTTHYLVGGPAGYITVTPDSGCNPIPVRMEFHDTGVVAASSNYIWSTCPFGTFTSTRSDTTLNYVIDGVYCPPTVTIQNGACAVTIAYSDSLRVYPLPFVGVTHLPILCYGRDTTLIATGADAYYHWEPAPSDITYYHPGDSSYVSIHPTATTTYTVTGYTTHGCVDTETTTIVVDPQLFLRIRGRDSMCIGSCDTLVASGVAGATYIWTGVGSSTAIGDTNIVCITSTKTYTASATNAAGCSASNTFKVTVNPAPVIRFSPNPAYICKGFDTTHVTAAGAAKYVWRSNQYLSCDSCASPIISTPANLVYTITGTSKFGCVDSIKVPVTVYDTNATLVSLDTSICKGTSAHLYASGGVKYQWIPSYGLDNPLSARPYANPDQTTKYKVYITENVCFRDTQSVTVTVIPLPIIKLPNEVTVLAGTSVQLFADTVNHVKLTNYVWTPADGTLSCIECPRPIATPTNTTTYSVTVSTIEGCAGSGSVTIKIICDNSQVFIPNTFTPNGDGVNDRFFVSGRGLGTITRMAIYNRWGEMIYETTGVPANDAGIGWDGTYKGQVLAPDVFVYVIDVTCSTGEPFSFKGDISIVR